MVNKTELYVDGFITFYKFDFLKMMRDKLNGDFSRLIDIFEVDTDI